MSKILLPLRARTLPGGYYSEQMTTNCVSHRTMSLNRNQLRIHAAYYRGGTSRAVMFREDDLPCDRKDWEPIFRGVLGSPDPNKRQLDGLGGGISSLSKICVISKSIQPGIDVDYNFVQVGIEDGKVDYGINCGNMASAVGPFAVESGLIPVGPGNVASSLTVRILNTNTNKVIDSTFKIAGGEAIAEGPFAIDGVAGTNASIRLDFLNPAGSKTSELLPTGKPQEVVDGVNVSCVDAGNPTVFVEASQIKEDIITATPEQLDADSGVLARLESIRTKAGVLMGIAERQEDVPASYPKVCLVGPSTRHTLLSGTVLEENSADVLVRVISMGNAHRAIPITISLAVAAAANTASSVVAQCLASSHDRSGKLAVGHPTGRRVVRATFTAGGHLESATIYQTARRLMEGTVFWRP